MLRTILLSTLIACPVTYAFAADTPAAPASSSAVASVSGTVADTTGAIIPGAQVQLTDTNGAVVASTTSDSSGNFRIQPPHQGDYSLVVNLQGFQTASQHVHAGATAGTPVSFALTIAAAVTQVEVNASSNVDLTASDEKRRHRGDELR